MSIRCQTLIGSDTGGAEKNKIQPLCSCISRPGSIVPAGMRALRNVGARVDDRMVGSDEVLKGPTTSVYVGIRLRNHTGEKQSSLLSPRVDTLTLAVTLDHNYPSLRAC